MFCGGAGDDGRGVVVWLVGMGNTQLYYFGIGKSY